LLEAGIAMAHPSKLIWLGLGALSLASLAGCDRPKPREQSQVSGPVGAPAPPAAPAAPAGPTVTISTEAPPPPPAWATALIGQPLRPTFPGTGACIGNTDTVDTRYKGGSGGAKIIGWGWDPAAKAAVQRVLLVDRDFKIVGAGVTGLDRPDVVAARPDVSSRTTGWQATTARTSGGLDSYGVLADGKSICKLGHIDL
jgi:hypothetical protein